MTTHHDSHKLKPCTVAGCDKPRHMTEGGTLYCRCHEHQKEFNSKNMEKRRDRDTPNRRRRGVIPVEGASAKVATAEIHSTEPMVLPYAWTHLRPGSLSAALRIDAEQDALQVPEPPA